MRCRFFADTRDFEIRKMLYEPEKIPLFLKLKEKSLPGVFVGLLLLAMAGWFYLIGTMFLKFVLWCFS